MTSHQQSDGDGFGERARAAADQQQDILTKSYRYLRLAMVGLLICLAAAVVIQSVSQGSVLGSVSAYYYTPAQAFFVGGLIGLGACMIALKGTPTVQDIALNLGGVFAAIVAIVPTGRSADYRALVRACEEAGTPLLTQKASTGLDCPTVKALEEATRANVNNNLWALLIVGLIALGATLFVAWRDGTLKPQADRDALKDFWWGFGAVSVLWLAVLVARLVSLKWVINNGHWIAAVLLFVCIFIVGAVNAWRVRREQPAGRSREGRPSVTPMNAVRETVGDLVAVRRRRDRSIRIARWMLFVGAASALLCWLGLITLFVLEGAVFVLFMAFWTLQTFEFEGSTKPTAVPQPSPPAPSTPTWPRSPA